MSIGEVEEQAARVWEQYKADEVTGDEFIAGIRALESALPEGMTIRFS